MIMHKNKSITHNNQIATISTCKCHFSIEHNKLTDCELNSLFKEHFINNYILYLMKPAFYTALIYNKLTFEVFIFPREYFFIVKAI